MPDEPQQPPVETPPIEPSLDDLKAQLAERDAQVKLYKDTLAALGNAAQNTPSPTTRLPEAASVPSDAAFVTDLARRHGYSEEQVAPWLPVIRDILRVEAAPAVQALYGVAERQAQLEAKLTIEDWKDLEAEATKIANDYRSRGVFLTPRDAAEIARGRLGPKLAAQRAETQHAQAEERGRQAQAAGEPSGTQKPGPSPSKQSPRPLTRAEIEALPRDERLKALESQLGRPDVTF